LRVAYKLAKENDGAPGIDGVSFETIEKSGVEEFLAQIRDELTRTYRPLRNRKTGIRKDGGKVRIISIHAIRDRVLQGALELILEPILEADFQDGSFGYRPKRTAHQAVLKVAQAIAEHKLRSVEMRERLGRAGRATVEAGYSAVSQAPRVLRVFESTVSAKCLGRSSEPVITNP
jgi:RNA-directed DNA polymerase